MEISERLVPYLPMIYVAWADGKLSSEELIECQHEVEHSELTTADRVTLQGWLDPNHPPSPETLRSMLDEIRRRSGSMSCSSRQGLSGLGMQLAEASGAPTNAATQEALSALERSLGVLGGEACSDLLGSRRPEAEDEPTHRWDSSGFAYVLQGPHSKVRQQVASFLQAHPPLPGAGGDVHEHRQEVRARLLKLAATGFAEHAYSCEGDSTSHRRSFLTAMEELAFGDLSLWVKAGVQFGLFGGAIHALGNDEHQKLLPKIAQGELLGCFAMSELGHGSNVMEIATTATYDHKKRCLQINTPSNTARKDYIGGAGSDARLAVVFAQLQVGTLHHGVHGVLVPIRDEHGQPLKGIVLEDCGPKLGLNGVDNGRIWFDRVNVPVGNLLDRFGGIDSNGKYVSSIPAPNKRFFAMLGTLVSGRIAVAGASVSATKTALHKALHYAYRRRQFGPAGAPELRLIDYQSHQMRLLPRLSKVVAYNFALAKIQADGAELGNSAESNRETETQVAAIKAMSSWNCVDTVRECRHACGGWAYLSESGFPSLVQDTDVFPTFEGDNTVLMQLVAKTLLSEFRSQLQDSQLFGLIRHVAKRARTAVTDKNPMAIRREDAGHLLDHDFHLQAFRFREEQLLVSLAKRLKKRIDAGQDSFLAFAAVSDHATSLGMAYAERLTLEVFGQAIRAAGLEQSPAEQLCQLYALTALRDARGWFVENGYLSTGKARAIRRHVFQLCHDLRPNALALVDALGVPKR